MTDIAPRGGASLQEELADYRAVLERQRTLLEGLIPISEEDARWVFASADIDEPNRYEDAVNAFAGFRQYAMTAEGAPVQVWYLKLHDASGGNDFLFVHLADVPALGFLVCASSAGGYIGYYKIGSALKDALGV